MSHTDYYQRLMNEIHSHNVSVGWWDNTDKWTTTTKLMLTVSEVAEAMEGDRKNLMDDKVTTRKMLEVELADTMIRLLDLGGFMKLNIDPNLQKRSAKIYYYYLKNFSEKVPVPVLLFQIVTAIVKLAESSGYEHELNHVIATINAVCEYLELDLKGAIVDKRYYNANREDHKRENRAKENGKTY